MTLREQAADLLDRAADMGPDVHAQRAWALTADDSAVSVMNPHACKFCVIGRVARLLGVDLGGIDTLRDAARNDEVGAAAIRAMRDRVTADGSMSKLTEWSDKSTGAEVVRVMREVAAELRRGGGES